MKQHHGLLVLGLLILNLNTSSAQETDRPTLKVLFIGNSYTSANDLPALVSALATAAGGPQIDAHRHLAGGCTFERHVKQTKAIDKIREQDWDAVVLQEQSLLPVINRNMMHKYARILHAEIKKNDAETIFYLTWARQHLPEMQAGSGPDHSSQYARSMYQISGMAKATDLASWCQQQHPGLTRGLNGAYFDIASELGATVAPVGMAWHNALHNDPRIALHRPDKSHPNAAGSYLAACVFIATLLDTNPAGLPGELRSRNKVLVKIPRQDARRLQEIAWETVQEVKQQSTEAQ